MVFKNTSERIEAYKKKVSIITVVYNAVDYLEEAILSVITQSYQDIEYIIIDGGSTDGSVGIIKKYEAKISYWVSEADDGIYDAMNKGIKLSNGEIIGILNADDWYERDAIEKAVNVFEKNPDVSLVHGAMNLYGQNGKLDRCYGSRSSIDPKYMVPFNHPTCFVDRKVYERIGKFDERFRTAADYDFMLRFLREGYNAVYIDEMLTNFRRVGTTSQMQIAPLSQIWKLLRSNGYSFFSSFIAVNFRLFRDLTAYLVSLLSLDKAVNYLKRFVSYHK